MQLGERLREARLEKELTLDDLQKETKIQKRYLESLEQNDWSVLPGQFYVRAFVREYAEAVGLDGEELLVEHKEELPTTSSQNYDYVTPSRSSRTSSQGSNTLFNFLPKMLVVLLIVAIIFAIYYAVINFMDPGESQDTNQTENEEVITAPEEDQEEQANEEQEQEETTDTEEQEEETQEETEEPTTQISVASADDSDSVETFYEVSNADQLNLSLETSNENWLRVEGDERHFDGMLTPDNSPIEFELEENEVYLNIGSTEGLTIYVNGEELEYEFHPDENNRYVRQHIYIELVEE